MAKREYGEGSVYLRGDRWHISYSHRGRLYRESSKSGDKKVAVRLLRRRLAEIHAGKHVPNAEKVTVADLQQLVETDYTLHERKSLDRVKRAFRHINDYFGPEARALDIRSDRLADYHRSRMQGRAALGTVGVELAILRRGFTLAVRAGRLQAKPVFPTIRPDNARQGWPTDDDLARLLRALPEHVRPAVRFAAITGWRIRSEILPMTWAQVSADEVRLDPGTTKNKQGRVWPLRAHPEVAAIIAEQRAAVDTLQRRLGAVVPYVFPNPSGQRIRSLSRTWGAAAKRTKVSLIPHDLRRGAARRMMLAGMPQAIVKRLCGWKTDAMLARYSIVAVEDLADGVARLAAYQGAAPSQARGATGSR